MISKENSKFIVENVYYDQEIEDGNIKKFTTSLIDTYEQN